MLAGFGTALYRRRWFSEAAEAFRQAVEAAPGEANYLSDLGVCLKALGRFDEADAALRRAIAAAPQRALLHCNLANLERDRGRFPEAETCYRTAIQVEPQFLGTYQNLGNLLLRQARTSEAIELGQQLVRALPTEPHAHTQLAVAFEAAKRPGDAARALAPALVLAPPQRLTMSLASYVSLAGAMGRLADRRVAQHLLERAASATLNAPVDAPVDASLDLNALRRFAYLMPYYGVADAVHLKLLATLGHALAAPSAPAAPRPAPPQPRFRVGYLSYNFGDHPIGHLLSPFFEAHDRRKVELILYSTNPRERDRSGYPERLRRAAGQFRDVSRLDDAGLAGAIRSDGPHLLIDLDGYLAGGRPEALARRPAAIQIHWLQHLAGMPAPFIDYSIVDTVLVGDDERDRGNGPLIRLPQAFQCGDRVRLSEPAPKRADFGLPEDALVFCGFNNWLKVDAEAFECWIAILAQTPGSVLWLSGGTDESAEAAWRDEARQRGVDPNRLVFARRLAHKAEHINRHRLADLFLDSFTFSAATTGIDALWAGLPVLTRRSTTAHGRISESQLRAIGVPELVTRTTAEYVAVALALARDRQTLAALRATVATRVRQSPLYDASSLARQFEALYARVWHRYASGDPPAGFDIGASTITEGAT
jgi:predicted O-linked N-acetylglucosamine transferase (SPINDLY family)